MIKGQKVELRVQCLGNPAYTAGYVVDVYKDFVDPSKEGVMVIFPNGNYDGFSHEEQGLFFCYDQHPEVNPVYNDYKFTNVIQLSRDFNKGFWKFIE